MVSAFYSMQDTKAPAIAAVVAMFVNILLALSLMGPLEHAGLALATALSAMVNIVILSSIITYRLVGIAWWQFWQSFGRSLLATVPVVLACLWIASLEVWEREDAWIAKTIMLVVGIGLSVTGYIGTHALYQSQELEVLWQLVQTKVLRKKTFSS